MKFVCDGCGKKYATSEDPSPGKVYKLKCKACGHLIVVKAVAGTSTAIPALTQAEQSAGAAGGSAPELEIEIEPTRTPPPAPVVPAEPAPPTQDLPPEVASAIDAAAPVPSAAPADEPLPPPPPPDKDELADFAAAAAEVMGTASAPAEPAAGEAGKAGYVDLFGDGVTGEHKLKADPFAAAAAPAPASAPARAAPAAPPTAKPAPRPAGGKSPSLLVYGGLGVALLGGIVAVAIYTGQKKDEAAPRPAVAAAPAPPPVEVAPPPKAEPPAEKEPAPPPRAEPAPPPAPRPAVAERRPEPPKARPPEKKPEPKPEPRPEPKAEPKPPPKVAAAPPPAPEPRTETREVSLPDAESALTPEVVQKVINANKKAFASCIAAAGPDVKLDGRKVSLKLTVNSNGAVTYPTLDDVTLNPTEMGQCLKSAARLMIFPKFKGDPFHVEVPLTLSN